MNEIEKMMQNAGVEALPYCCNGCCGTPTKECKDCYDYREIYPSFTAEKQLELIKWLATKDYGKYTTSLLINVNSSYVRFSAGLHAGVHCLDVKYDKQGTNFEEALAGLINLLWQDLTEEEKQQIREILE